MAPQGWSEQIDLMLSSGSRSLYRVKCFVGILLVFVFLIDAASTVVCRAAPSIIFEKQLADWSAKGLLEGLKNYNDDTVDLMLLYIVRTLALILMGWMAVRLGTPNLSTVPKRGAADETVAVCPPCSNGATASGSSVQPLLINGADAAGGGGAASVGPASSAPKPTTEVKEEHLLSHQRKLAAESLKAYAVGAIFLTSTTV